MATTKPYPRVTTPLPGPAARRILEQDEKYISPSYTRSYPLVAVRGRGMAVEDPDGNVFLDFAAGIAVCATGHCHPEIVKTIHDSSSELIHMSGTDFYYPAQTELAKKLSDVLPGRFDKRVFFTNSGTESIEAAIKLARYATGRTGFVAFWGAFHGRSFGALSLTASKATQRRGFFPMLPGAVHAPYGVCYRCPINLTYPSCDAACVKFIEDEIFSKTLPPEDCAAIVVEPIQGEGGYVVPPEKWMPRLRELCDRHGILLVADEVQSGMGRTGKMLAIEHTGVVPDIVCLAKGIASGLPLGAMVAPASLMTWKTGAHASTFGGNPIACRAALKTIELLERGLMKNAADVGAYMMERLEAMKRSHRMMGDVRGRGLMIGVEIVKDASTRERAPEARDRIVQRAFERGLLVLGAGKNTVRLCPPLVLDREDADIALAILEDAIAAAEGAERGPGRGAAAPVQS